MYKFVAIFHKTLSYWAQRSIHEFEVWIYILKYGFFILNSKRILNSMDFSLSAKAQNDKFIVFNPKPTLLYIYKFFSSNQHSSKIFTLWIFRYAQNDNVDFLLWFAPCKSLGRLLQRLKMTSICLSYWLVKMTSAPSL